MLKLWERISELPFLAIISLILVSFIGLVLYGTSNSYRFTQDSPKPTRDTIPILGSMGFFTRRWSFLRDARDTSSTGNFSFWLGKHPVVALCGHEARGTYLETRGLSFGEGYGVLFGQGPHAASDNGNPSLEKEFSGPGAYFHRRITRMLKMENFIIGLPKMKVDMISSIRKLEADPSGITDPFESIYRTVYLLTMRMVGCDDIAEDPVLAEKSLRLYMAVDECSSWAFVVFPSWPTPKKFKQTIAAGKLYMMISKIVDKRNKAGIRRDDPLQYLVDNGDNMRQIVQFVLGALFAGLLNSGINAAWVLCYLANNTYWLNEVRTEINSVAAKYCPDKDIPLIDKLDYIPAEAWENDFPIGDLCLRDSIRINMPGTSFRKNITGASIPIAGTNEVIPPDALVVHPLYDAHMNPDIYPEPTKWDPARYLPDRAEDKKVPYAYMGWGVGRHPCLGMRLAKVEQNMITAYFCAAFDFEMCDKKGQKIADWSPEPEWNAHSAVRPQETKRSYLRYWKREDKHGL